MITGSDIEFFLEKYFATKRVNICKQQEERQRVGDKNFAYFQIQWLELFIYEFQKHEPDEILPQLEQNEK